ncbi:2-oxo acid dehydrogenase subunit E2 [Chitinophagaceae bacterium LB-8]|uniref:Dihydrolipoamide acetyltransferase component of pyruvate dehydrogenase complex n=1 Tax=Paraflavisolibacter caeni TaxID=2982496 RepID=A0A9X2XPF5_9BACT|nr:2-oxo acid dehydrogenase subunit E2 [Paraflavisolibacter caeni]MCU7551203.1 2-oxo acid dehydrogenase subunit E2 [Paraflavisolibacter caeni]
MMQKEIKLPKIAEGVESATVTNILVSEGDAVEKAQSLIVVESDKASVEVPSEAAGKVSTIKVKENDEIKVGDVILVLESEEEEQSTEGAEEKEGEQPTEATIGKEVVKEKEEEPKKEKVSEEEKTEPKEGTERTAVKKEEKKGEVQPVAGGKVQPVAEKEKQPVIKPEEEEKAGEEDRVTKEQEIAAAPNVLRLARELGIQVNELKGSGPEGRILEEDVMAYAKEIIQGKGRRPVQEEPPLPDFSNWGEIEKVPLKGIRRATAKRTAVSWNTIPHVTHFDQAEISKIEELRANKNHLAEQQGGKLTVTAILLKIVAEALQEFPMLNASIDVNGQEIILKKYIHIGVAVDTERGLLVPVVRDVNKKNLINLSVELTELSEKARKGKLTVDEMKGGSFTISNVGGIGGTNFTQLIYHPQAAILGVAKAELKPIFIDGEFKPKLMLPLSLSYDHRLIDGADAARFLRWICDVIENPLNLLIDE